MKCRVVTLTELMEGNRRFCLSAKRALNLCWQCKLYPTCESKIINETFDADKEEIRKLTATHTEKIKAIKDKWSS